MKVQTEDIVAIIKEAKTMIEMDHLTADADLRDIGADSLDMMNILLEITDKYGIDVPDNDLVKLKNITAICTYINQSEIL